jgi:hypothetical protein
MSKIVGIGNCQITGMIRSAAEALGLCPVHVHPKNLAMKPGWIAKIVAEAEIVFAQRVPWADEVRTVLSRIGRSQVPVVSAPRLKFSGFHPDLTMGAAGKFPWLPMGTAHSAILLAAWRDGLEPEDALTLFRDEVYEELGYYQAYASSRKALLKECAACGLDANRLLESWEHSGAFFYVPLHPKMNVLWDIGFELLRSAGLYDGKKPDLREEDPFSTNLIWPIYPEIAEKLGLSGDYVFWPNRGAGATGEQAPMSLEQFIARTFDAYRRSPPDLTTFPRMSDPRLGSITSFARGRRGQHHDFTPGDWRASEAAEEAEVAKVICDEELLDNLLDDELNAVPEPSRL